MKSSQIALQIYTLRDFCRSSAELAQTLSKIRTIGYQAVEMIRFPNISDDELRKLADQAGVAICSIHESGQRILNEPSRAVESLDRLGIELAVYPFPAGLELSKREQAKRLIEQLQRSSEAIAQKGKRLAYHNHGLEFCRHDGKTLLELIFGAAPDLYAEPDTYWIQFGGGNPIAWVDSLQRRLPAIHLKDYAFNAEQNRPEMAELGRGNLDLPAIIRRAEVAGCRWFIVEQDVCPADPFDSIRISFEYLQTVVES